MAPVLHTKIRAHAVSSLPRTRVTKRAASRRPSNHEESAAAKGSQPRKRYRPSMYHLPEWMRANLEDFKEILIPETRRLLGALRDPWELLDLETIQRAVDDAFPGHEDYEVTDGDDVHRLVSSLLTNGPLNTTYKDII